MKMWRKLDQDHQHIVTLRFIVGILVLINFLLWLGWHQAPKDLTIHVPPDLSSGVTLKANDIPSADLYSFTFYVWQVIGNWPDNGETDYLNNIQRYSPYLTPNFKNQLLEEIAQLNARGEIQDRTRVVQGEIGSAYQASNVTNLGNSTWEVDVTVRVTERIGNTILQDALIEYPLRVVRYDINRQTNQWGLALDGFVSEPKRIQTFI